MASILDPENRKVPDIKRMIDKYGNSILRMCFLYLKDKHLAEDAIQDTFIKVYNNYPKFKGKSNEKTWIIRIAINVCKNYLRKSWWKHIDISTALDSIPVYEDSYKDDTLLIEVMKLSPKYKEVIILFYYQEMKIREIAEALQIPESTVSIRLRRARDILKSNLEDWYYDEW